ncbi:MAG TPA: acyltransferase [Actinocrinis sp.]|nr:acyltransferase [Actinocrinis sp.]
MIKTAQGPAGRYRELGRNPALDGYRGLAVLLVVCDHAHIPMGAPSVGVDLFFVLSGFLITSLLAKEHDQTGRISLRRFYRRRARRILPGLFLLTVGVVAVSLSIHQLQDRWPLWWQVATTWTFTSNATVWLAKAPIGAFTATWSLACEEQFYLLWPLVLLLAFRRHRSPRRIVGWLGAAVLLLVGGAWYATVHVPASEPFFSPIGRAAELMLGCALALAWRHRLLPRWIESRATGPLALAAGTALMIAPLYRPSLGAETIYEGAALAGALILLGLLTHPDSVMFRCFSFAPLRYTGKISYGLYLDNDAVSRLLHHNLPGRPWTQIAPLLAVGAFACAVPSYHLVEARFLRQKPAAPRSAIVAATEAAESSAAVEPSEGVVVETADAAEIAAPAPAAAPAAAPGEGGLLPAS